MHVIAKQLNELRTELNDFFQERDEVIYASLLAVLAKEHAFLLGPPGTGKSQLIRALVGGFSGASYFEIALSKTRSTEAVLGPMDITAFRDRGEYRIKRAGYATDVDYLLLDEGGKMSPILGHDLLALLNERVYHEVSDGRSAHKAPLMSAFVPSNEVITTESDDAAALWDRLLVRVMVDYVKNRSAFARLLLADNPTFTTSIDFTELREAIEVDVAAVQVSEDALVAIMALRERMAKEHIHPSDRRFRASIKVLKAAAFLDGRSEVTEEDVAVLRFTLWDTVEQFDRVTRMCLSVANPFYEDLMNIRTGLQEIAQGISERQSSTEGERLAYGKEAQTKLKAARTELDNLARQSPHRRIPNFKEVAQLHEMIVLDTFTRCLGQDEDVAEIAAKRRLGLGDGEEFWT